jgi:hypothetical protein
MVVQSPNAKVANKKENECAGEGDAWSAEINNAAPDGSCTVHADISGKSNNVELGMTDFQTRSQLRCVC